MKWMQTRASELAGNETWQASCVASYGRVPQPKEMSIKELEETLTAVGDQEVKAMRDKTETMFEGTIVKFLPNQMEPYGGDAFACFVEVPGFESQVYAHQAHLAGMRKDDQVQISVHQNAKGQYQVCFMDRLNNKAVASRGDDTRIVQMSGGGGGKGGMKGGKGWDGGWGEMMVQLPDGSFAKGMPVGAGKDKGKGWDKGWGKGKPPMVLGISRGGGPKPNTMFFRTLS